MAMPHDCEQQARQLRRLCKDVQRRRDEASPHSRLADAASQQAQEIIDSIDEARLMTDEEINDASPIFRQAQMAMDRVIAVLALGLRDHDDRVDHQDLMGPLQRASCELQALLSPPCPI